MAAIAPVRQAYALTLAIWLGIATFGLEVCRRRRWRTSIAGLIVGTVSPAVIGIVVAPWLPSWRNRFALVAVTAVIILGATWFRSHRPRWRFLPWLALAAMLVAWSGTLEGWYSEPDPNPIDYGQGIQKIVSQAAPGDVVILNNPEQVALFDIYSPKGIPGAELSRDDVFTPERADARLTQITGGYRRAWLINYGDLAVYDPQRRAEQWLSAHGYREFFQSYKTFELSRYVLAMAAPPDKPTISLAIQFADGIELQGVDLQPQPVQPGGTLLVTLFWKATASPSKRYTIFTHLLSNQGQLMAQFDGEPAGGTRPTTDWKPGATIVDRRAIAVPQGLPPGTLTLRAGMYVWPDMTRLPVLNVPGVGADQSVPIATITVQ